MEAKCRICGSTIDLPKTHKDYQKLAQNPKASYICETCQKRLMHQAQRLQKVPKPL
ncbi:MAG: DUF2197 domain-containing protein [Clostridia bacterium]|nr:DUF2197 domain-containing protein [Clostridia bacterium]